jgi:hypothetical protein
MAMEYQCNKKEASISRGRPVVTLPVLLFSEYHHFKSFEQMGESKSEKPSLYKLRNLAIDRDGWAGFMTEICWVFETL